MSAKHRTPEWRRLRQAKLQAEPLCREHRRFGETVPATDVDHIDGNETNDEWENLQPLCHECHSRKTATENGGFGNQATKKRPPVGLDGWPKEEREIAPEPRSWGFS